MSCRGWQNMQSLRSLHSSRSLGVVPTSDLFLQHARRKLDDLRHLKQWVVRNDDDNDFPKVVLNHMRGHYIDKKYNIREYRINPQFNFTIDNESIPDSPVDMNGIPRYAFELMRRNDFELSEKNREKRGQLMHSLSNVVMMDEGMGVADLEGGQEQMLTKCVLLNRIVGNGFDDENDDDLEKLFGRVKFDRDVFYLAMALYYVNPYRLEKYGRLNQVERILEHCEGGCTIHEGDWERFEMLVLGNLFNAEVIEMDQMGVVLKKLKETMDSVNESYWRFELVDMLRHLRNAELGYEVNIDGVEQVLKFGVGYYRFKIIERVSNEWAKEYLRQDVWEEYNLREQWRIVYNTYYANESIDPPGGEAMKRRIGELIL